MISVSGKTWTEQKVNKNLVEKFKHLISTPNGNASLSARENPLSL